MVHEPYKIGRKNCILQCREYHGKRPVGHSERLIPRSLLTSFYVMKRFEDVPHYLSDIWKGIVVALKKEYREQHSRKQVIASRLLKRWPDAIRDVPGGNPKSIRLLPALHSIFRPSIVDRNPAVPRCGHSEHSGAGPASVA